MLPQPDSRTAAWNRISTLGRSYSEQYHPVPPAIYQEKCKDGTEDDIINYSKANKRHLLARW
jgi:hypothetical protein